MPVSVLQSIAAAKITNIRRSRDFRSSGIFDFFNNIRQVRSSDKHSFRELVSVDKIDFAGSLVAQRDHTRAPGGFD
jgi:hypothetical protein